METVITKNFDEIVKQARILKSAIEGTLFDEKLIIEQVLSNTTSFYSHSNKGEQYLKSRSIEDELSKLFISQRESKLQDGIANHLIGLIDTLFRQIYEWIRVIIENNDYDATYTPGKINRFLNQNARLCYEIKPLVEIWIYSLIKVVRIFAPERYAERRSMLDKILPIYNDIGEEIDEDSAPAPKPEPEPTAPVKKSRKKDNISLKQQMILLDMLGVLKSSVWPVGDNTRKAAVLAQLLNRSEQEVRSMLTYWGGSKPPADYDCTGAEDTDVVTDLLINNRVYYKS